MAPKLTPQALLQQLVDYHSLLKEREASHGGGRLAAPISLINQIERYEEAIERTKEALAHNITYETLQQDLAYLDLDFSAEITIRAERKFFDGRNPYRGLEKFTEEDAEFFFGRTAATARLVSMTRQLIEAEIGPKNPALLTVVGASGSGKSSLVRAGLIPKLRQGAVKDSERWPIKVMVPGRSPLDALSAQFKGLLERGAPLIRRELDSGPKALHLLLREALSDQPDNLYYTLVIDQFEELFTLCESEQERREFIDLILYEAYQRDQRGLTILTMRADFYGRALAYKNLAEAITTHQFGVSPLTEAELREAILLPAEAVGLEMERDLALALVQDTAKEPGRLPLLQHALLELFNRRTGDNVLTLAAYNEIGGVPGALTHRAGEIWQGLTPEQQQLARRIFVELTELGEGVSDTRRRVSRSRLDTLGDPIQIETVLQKLSGQEARLVVAGTEVEVTHEALIQQWGQLRDWLDEDRESIRLHRRLTTAAGEWQIHSQDPAYLYTGSILAQAEEWEQAHRAEMTQLEQAFLTASIDEREREAAAQEAQRQRELAQAQALAEEQRRRAEEQIKATTRLRKRNIGLAVFGVMAVFLAIAASVFGFQSRQNEALAEGQARFATSRELAAAAVANLPIDPERSLLLAQQALMITYTVQAEQALRQALQALRVERRLSDHSTPLRGIAFSPDGTYLAAGGQDQTVKIWHISNPQPEKTLQILSGHTDRIESVVFSPDGTRLATAGDKTARVWDIAATDKVSLTLMGHTDWVLSVAFSADGRRLATASVDGTAKIWDADSGKMLSTLSGHQGAVIGVAFSPNDKRLVTTGQDGTVKVWDSLSGQELQTLLGHTDQVYDAAFSPDGTRLATVSQDRTIRIWDVSNLMTDKPIQTLFGHTNTIVDIDFSLNGRCLATTSADKTAKVWDTSSGEILLTLAGHSDWVYGVAFDPQSNLSVIPTALCGVSRLATSSLDGTVRIWNIGASREWLTLSGHTDAVQAVAFSPDGQYLATASSDSTAKIWNFTPGQIPLNLTGHIGKVNRIVYSSDGKYLATVSDDTTAKIWAANSGQMIQTFAGHEDIVWGVAFSPDGVYLATASQDKTAKLWDISSGRLLQSWSDPNFLYNVTFSPDGSHLATAGEDGYARIWKIDSAEMVSEFHHPPQVYDLAFSPDGLRLATAGTDSTTKLWEVASKRELKIFNGHIDRIFGLEFSADGLWLATASADKSAIVWEVASGQALHTMSSPTREITDIDLSPNGKQLATAGEDGTVRIYLLDLEELIKLAQTRLTRSWTIEECQQFLHQEECPNSP